MAKTWGFNTRELDMSIRPQDDFFGYVNHRWMKAHPIPANESRWGTFVELRYKTDKQLRAILTSVLRAKGARKGSAEQMIRDFYRSGIDEKRRDTLGVAPLAPIRAKIRTIHSQDDLLAVIALLHRMGMGAAWDVGVDQDDKQSERYVLRIGQSGLGMPDRDYYLKSDPESKRVRDAYEQHVEAVFRLIGKTPEEASAGRRTLLAIETRLAKASMKKEDLRDPHKVYNKMTIARLSKIAPTIVWRRYFNDILAPRLATVVVNQPGFFTAVSRMLKDIPLADWQTYLDWHVVNAFSSVLSTPFVKQSFAFYGTTLSGTKKMRPRWRRILGTVNGYLGEALGELYVKKHFTTEAKRHMHRIVDDLFTAYEARINALDWMSPTTKRKALAKLRALNRKIGYPDRWKGYRGLLIRSDDYVGNIMRANEFEHARELKKLYRPVERWVWHMYPQTVNAYFSPNLNDIVFPAAILQSPFFSMNADDALNYGCIGAVIGHEITHGFDDEGSKFDAKGNLQNWWTGKDRARFERRAKLVEKQFDCYTVADGVKVNGKLTLGENIADLGGLTIALDAYRLALRRSGAPAIGGLSPEQRFFIGFAMFERENVRPEFEKTQVLTDPHSPGKFRINGPLSNIEAFYDAFGVKKGDQLYRNPKERAKIW